MATILIVDDREADRRALVGLLKARGHRTIEACDGAMGLDCASRQPPDLIVTDIVMPHMDGYEFLRQVRLNERLKGTPVVVYTATYIEEAARALADRCGVFSVVERSARAEDLMRVLEDAIRSAPPSYAIPDDQFGFEHRRVLTDKLAEKVTELEAEIARRKEIEASLVASESRLLLAMEASGLRIWDWDLSNDSAIMTDGVQHDGRPLSNVRKNVYKGLIESVHPDDRDRYRGLLEAAHRERREFRIEYRLRSDKGEYRNMETRGRFLFEADGSSNRAVGTTMDITDRVRSEQERRLQATLVDNSVELIGVVRSDGRVSFFNPAGLRLLGLNALKEESTIFDFLCIEDVPILKDRGLVAARAEGSWRGEVRFLNRETGTAVPCECTAFAIHDTDGALEHIAIIAKNISERVHAQALLESRVSQLLALRNIEMAISGAVDLNLTLNVIVNEVQSQPGVLATCIYLHDPHIQEIEVASCSGFFSGHEGDEHCEAYRPLALRAVKERRRVAAEAAFDVQTSGPSELVPLIAKGSVKGVLTVVYSRQVLLDQREVQFIEALAGQAANAIETSMLFEDLQRSKNELAIAYDETIEGWSRALDLRDKETDGHSRRVTELTMKIARKMRIPSNQLQHMRRGALLHDIGKVGVPDSILLKPGPLTDDEWRIMRMHTVYAFNLLSPIEFLKPAMEIPYCHHEKWDGTGYPRRLCGEQIPLAARIFAVADVWDAIRSDRPYRAAWTHETAVKHIASLSGTHFDPQVVDHFLELVGPEEGDTNVYAVVDATGHIKKRLMG